MFDTISFSNSRKKKLITTVVLIQLAFISAVIVTPLLSLPPLPDPPSIPVPIFSVSPPPTPKVKTTKPAVSHGGIVKPIRAVVPIFTGKLTYGKPVDYKTQDTPDNLSPNIGLVGNSGSSGPNLIYGPSIAVKPPAKPLRISHTTDAMLLKKVIPEYPVIARNASLQGEVRLHAVVSKDGVIQSLSVIGNPPPVLLQAAMNAVKQWVYRPFMLNGEPVEIETFITVNFKKE